MTRYEEQGIQCVVNCVCYADKFLNWLDRTPKTKESYMKNLRSFFKYMNEQGIQIPDRQTILSYKEYLKNSGYQPTTIQSYLNTLKNFFKWLEAEGIFEKDISEGIRCGKVNKLHKKEAISKDEFLDVLSLFNRKEDIQSLRDKAIVLLEGVCGLRCIEVERMNVEDIREEQGTKVLYLQRKGHEAKDFRLPIPYKVEKAIRKYLFLRNDLLQDKDNIFSNPNNKGKAMFTSLSHKEAEGTRLTTRSISRLIKEAYLKCDIVSSKKTAHSLRHFFATENLNQGTPLKAVSEAMGHSNLMTTQIYISKDDILKNKAFGTLESILDEE